jgi:nucleotide-binding universal stress UspA family protein
MPDLIRHPGGEVAGYRLSPVWIQNAIFEVIRGGKSAMFKKIMVCLDGSELAEKVLPYAIQEAICFSSELVLFRVVSEALLVTPVLPGISGLPIDAARAGKRAIAEENEAREYLRLLVEKIQVENELRINFDTAQGTAGPEIIRYCLENQIELVAIATHGRSGPGRVVMGSIADYVVRHSSLPLLLIRPH